MGTVLRTAEFVSPSADKFTSEAAHTDCRGKSLCFALYMLLATKGSYNFLSVNKNNQVGILESIESGFSDKKKQQQLLDTSVTSSPSLE